MYRPQYYSYCFNPRPRMGGDRMAKTSGMAAVGFNPRPRMGGDQYQLLNAPTFRGFNPRPRMGGDRRGV